MKNVKILGLALGLSVSLSVVSALDLSSIGKGLEAAQNAGLVKSDHPTQKQFDAKVVQNARANVEECKKFYHKEMIVFRGIVDFPLSDNEKARIDNLLGEYDQSSREPLGTFDLKPLMKDYTKNKDDDEKKDRVWDVCKRVLAKGLSEKEAKEFAKETNKKYNNINGTDIPRNKKK